MTDKIFKRIKVVEFSSVLAGPAVGMFFAELGATVIKIENKNGGDLTRSWKQPGEPATLNISAYYHSVNWNKKVVFLDLKNEKDREQAFEELKDAEIMISNFKSGDDVKFGLDPASLKKQFPSLIIAIIKGFVDSDRLAYDAVLQAETGFMSMNGTPESGPLKMPVALIDLLAAHQLKEGILCAMIHRMKSGKGSIVETSLYESALAPLANQAANWLNNKMVPGLSGSLHPNIAPYGEVFYSEDNFQFIIAAGTDQQFIRLCGVIDLPELLVDLRFTKNTERVIHRKILAEILQQKFSKLSWEEIFKKLNAEKIPAGKIMNIKQVFESTSAAEMILVQNESDGSISKRVKTVAFTLQEYD
ncbi:CaiB/BaiF CoA-transferase family protein [soil metagenome]